MKKIIMLSALSLSLNPMLSYSLEVVQDEGEVYVEFDPTLTQDYEHSVKEAPGAETKVEVSPSKIIVKHLKSQESGSALYLKVKPGAELVVSLSAGKIKFVNLGKFLNTFEKVYLESSVGTINGAKSAGLKFKRSLVGASSWNEAKGTSEVNAKVQAGLVEVN